jgi:hypothetical protein
MADSSLEPLKKKLIKRLVDIKSDRAVEAVDELSVRDPALFRALANAPKVFLGNQVLLATLDDLGISYTQANARLSQSNVTGEYYCDVCDMRLRDREAFDEHLSGKHHYRCLKGEHHNGEKT